MGLGQASELVELTIRAGERAQADEVGVVLGQEVGDRGEVPALDRRITDHDREGVG